MSAQKPMAKKSKAEGTKARSATGLSAKAKAEAGLREGMVYETRPAPIRYKGLSVPSQLTAWWAKTGDDAVIEADQLADHDQIYRALRDYVNTSASGASVRKFRQALNLSQKEAGELLGGGPRAFQKYESGEVELSQSMFNLLRLLANDPSRLDELRVGSDNLPPPLPRPKETKNRKFNLWRRKGLGEADLVLVTADGLRQHITLVELKHAKQGRDWSFLTQRMGVNHKGKVVYRTGPLDKKPVEVIVNTALQEHGLDPAQASWDDILNAVDA